MLNITLERTQIERIDANRTLTHEENTVEHLGRVEAHRLRVQREYFDSGLHYLEQHPAQIDKKCFTCKETKPIDDFFRNKDSKDGYWANCKICHRNSLLND